MEEIYSEGEPRELIGCANAAAQDVIHIVSDAQQWSTLLYVAEGVYMNPSNELEKEKQHNEKA